MGVLFAMNFRFTLQDIYCQYFRSFQSNIRLEDIYKWTFETIDIPESVFLCRLCAIYDTFNTMLIDQYIIWAIVYSVYSAFIFMHARNRFKFLSRLNLPKDYCVFCHIVYDILIRNQAYCIQYLYKFRHYHTNFQQITFVSFDVLFVALRTCFLQNLICSYIP